ncbi:hypothetical protein XdyCFBP7245_15380 [Xanthomonas dyei]|uniref:Uncharacterized protein n=1 Tax=Xanthomonas dyei TaxID=743699 RepID=A0A2S7C0C9_9XANT|nr:hypothetical protein XdyCFBP7245_15380 [Xanthomonas dyei]
MTSTVLRPTPTAKPAAGSAPGPECPDALIGDRRPAGRAAAMAPTGLAWAQQPGQAPPPRRCVGDSQRATGAIAARTFPSTTPCAWQSWRPHRRPSMPGFDGTTLQREIR